MTVNEISNPNNNSEDNRVELATYDKLRHVFRYHWAEGRKQARSAKECINSMVIILHQENPEWPISKIANKIAMDNQDLEGFSKSTIYNNLNEENRMLLDTSKQNRNKVPEQSVPALEQKNLTPPQSKEDTKITVSKKEYEKFKKWEEDDTYARKDILVNGRIKSVVDKDKPLYRTEYERAQGEFGSKHIYLEKYIEKIIDFFLGLTQEEETQIIINTPKGMDYQKKMIEKARNNMITISKKLNDTDITPLQNDFRFLTKVITAMSDILYDESQLRKKNNPEKLK